MPTLTITEFLLARIAEDEQAATLAEKDGGYYVDGGLRYCCPGYETVPHLTIDSTRVLADCKARRAIVEFHRSWPVLATTPILLETVDPKPGDATGIVVRATQRHAWLTQREYVTRFGTEPPTAPVLAALAAVYAEHPDYDPAWVG